MDCERPGRPGLQVNPSAILLLQGEVSEWHFAVDICIVV
jgi:hypothetical protein